jgi:hypothetical protein
MFFRLLRLLCVKILQEKDLKSLVGAENYYGNFMLNLVGCFVPRIHSALIGVLRIGINYRITFDGE